MKRRSAWLTVAILFHPFSFVAAESGAEGWLRYSPQQVSALWKQDSLPSRVVVFSSDEVVKSAANELTTAVPDLQITASLPDSGAVALARTEEVRKTFPELSPSGLPSRDGFWLKTVRHRGSKYWLIVGASDRG